MRITVLLFLALASCAPLGPFGIYKNSIATDRALAYSEVLVRKTRAVPGTLSIVDSGGLYRVLKLDDAAVEELKQRLPANFVVAPAVLSERCARPEASNRSPCQGIHIGEFRERRGKLELAVHWFPIGGCGSYGALYVVQVKKGVATIKDIPYEDFGDCAPRSDWPTLP